MSPPAGGAAAGAAAGALAASAEDSIVVWPDSTTSVTRRALMTVVVVVYGSYLRYDAQAATSHLQAVFAMKDLALTTDSPLVAGVRRARSQCRCRVQTPIDVTGGSFK